MKEAIFPNLIFGIFLLVTQQYMFATIKQLNYV